MIHNESGFFETIEILDNNCYSHCGTKERLSKN